MRKSIISSLIATVVAIANDRLVDAGLVAVAGLRRNSMREHLGNWHEPMFAFVQSCHQPMHMQGGTPGLNQTGRTRLLSVLGNVINVATQLTQRSSKRSMQHAFAYCPAYAALAKAAPKG